MTIFLLIELTNEVIQEEEEDYEDTKNGGNGYQRPKILQHIHPPNPIVYLTICRGLGRSGSCNMIFG
jgi:hypothetical protein